MLCLDKKQQPLVHCPMEIGFPVGTRLTGPEEQRDSTRMTRFDAPTAPVFADAEVATINRFGKLTDYQKVGDNFFRTKADGSLAAAPATGLTAMNLRNPDSPIVSRQMVSRPTGDDIALNGTSNSTGTRGRRTSSSIR